MQFFKHIVLKNGQRCTLRNATSRDGQAALDIYILTHAQTDDLACYPEEIHLTAREQAECLQAKTDSDNEIELLAEIDGKIVGAAGIEQKSPQVKLKHRCEMGISIDKDYWGLGIGSALTEACIACAKRAGYEQIELAVIAANDRAIRMYDKAGFAAFGRNPRGLKSRLTGYQEVIYMRKELT